MVVARRRGVYLRPMTDAALTPPDQSIDETLAELAEEFDLLGDWEPRIEYVIELGKGLAPLPDHARVEANKVPGCAAQVWLHVIRDGGRLYFLADSDSHLSKGNIALLLRLYSGREPDQILAFDARAAHGPPGPAPGPHHAARQRPERHDRADPSGSGGGRLNTRRCTVQSVQLVQFDAGR